LWGDYQGAIHYNRASEDTGIAGVDGRYKQTTLGIDALYMFSRDKFRPFLVAAIGAERRSQRSVTEIWTSAMRLLKASIN